MPQGNHIHHMRRSLPKMACSRLMARHVLMNPGRFFLFMVVLASLSYNFEGFVSGSVAFESADDELGRNCAQEYPDETGEQALVFLHICCLTFLPLGFAAGLDCSQALRPSRKLMMKWEVILPRKTAMNCAILISAPFVLIFLVVAFGFGNAEGLGQDLSEGLVRRDLVFVDVPLVCDS